jgi:wyosine [tRNA(Phe)-imidazoG37] synthetase (radical SAM superfamily)
MGDIMQYSFLTFEKNEHFGICLKINFFQKTICNFNCIYCKHRSEEKYNQRVFLFPVVNLIDEISDFMDNNPKPDSFYFTGYGETTMYILYGAILSHLKKNYPDIQRITKTNSSLLQREDIRTELAMNDIVIAKLDGITENIFQSINQPSSTIDFQELLSNLEKFRRDFSGELWINTTFVKGYNDSSHHIDILKEYLTSLNPNTLLISTVEKNNSLKMHEGLEDIKQSFEELAFQVKYF